MPIQRQQNGAISTGLSLKIISVIWETSFVVLGTWRFIGGKEVFDKGVDNGGTIVLSDVIMLPLFGAVYISALMRVRLMHHPAYFWLRWKHVVYFVRRLYCSLLRAGLKGSQILLKSIRMRDKRVQFFNENIFRAYQFET